LSIPKMARSFGCALFVSAALVAAAGQATGPVASDSKSPSRSGSNLPPRVSPPRALKVRQAKPQPAHDHDDVPPALAPGDLVPAQPMFPDLPPLRTIYGSGGGVTPPQVTIAADSVHDDAEGKAKDVGTVVLELIVTPDGHPEDIKVVTSPSPGLDNKAIEAVSKWKFAPATKDGKPVAVKIRVEVKFALY
jgi:TonB family protein